jgi:hypothetical protein
MRTLTRLGFGALVVLSSHSLALAQRFGEDRPAAPTPMAPVAPTPVTPKVAAPLPTFPVTNTPRPVVTPTPTAPIVQEAPHEWSIRPEHGEWMICVKSYINEKSREHAIELAGQIRTNFKAATYLFEKNAEDRMREEKRLNDFRDAKRQELEPFLRVQAEMKSKAGVTGAEYIDTPTMIRTPKTANIIPQYAVLVGGFKDMDTARLALNTIRKWPVPKGEHLLDRAVIQGADNKTETAYINPFTSAMVVRNPSIRSTTAQQMGIDPSLWKLNEEEPLSLLRSPKTWTLIVKDFTVPLSVQIKDQEGTIMAKLFGKATDPADLLDATAKQARELAKALRDGKMQRGAEEAAVRAGLTPRPIESFILHLRTGSRVTVGQFDGPNDPALLEMHKLLSNMHFEVWDKPREQGGRMIEKRHLFDGITPMPIPKQ